MSTPETAAAIQANLETALVHHREGRWPEAERIYRQVLSVNPDEPNALHLLGLLAYQTGQYAPAIELITRAISLAPRMPTFHNTLGVALHRMRRFDEAASALKQAIALNPNYDEPWFNLSSVYSDRALNAQAEDCLRRALAVRPNYWQAWCSLGNALVKQGKLAEGTDAYRKAIEFNPNYADAWNNLGNMQQQQGLLCEALESYERAVAADPRHVSSLENRGTALCHLGRIEESLAAYRQAAALQPEPAPSTKLLLALNYSTHIGDEELFAEHRRFGQWLEARTPRLPAVAVHRDPERMLRVGYVSGDFRDHAVAHFLMSIVAHHDRTQFHPVAYSDVLIPDAMTDRLKRAIPWWRECYGADDDAVAQQVRRDGIDILIDLSGHTSLNRLGLFAMRPAPVQVSYLGYANTTGLTTIDHQITDAVVDPLGAERWYTENLVRIEPGFACYTPPDYAPEVTPLPASTAEGITIGSLHGLAKLNDEVLDLWARVLRETPETRLLMYRHSLRGRTVDALREEFTRRGIDAARLTIQPHSPDGSTHLGVYGQIDLTLDVFPWSGHTTACEALWMGVPIVTLRGNRHAGRMVSSVLNSLGRNEWIADTPGDYARIAVELCRDRQALAAIRAGLRDEMRRSALCDAPAFARRFEAALRQMWRAWCERP